MKRHHIELACFPVSLKHLTLVLWQKTVYKTVCVFDSRNHLAINLAKVTCERERTAKSNSASNPPITLDDDDLIANDEKV